MSLLDLSLQKLDSVCKEAKYPWQNAIDFFENPKFAGARLFPNQRLLLKLWNLQTDFTEYERQTLDKWRAGFEDEYEVCGVNPNVLEKIEKLKDNGWEWFPQIIEVSGRQAGKTFMVALQLSYCIACLLVTENFGLPPQKLGHEPRAYVMATKAKQAKDTIFKDLYNAVLVNPFFRPYLLTALPTRLEFTTLNDAVRSEKLKLEMAGKKIAPFVSLQVRPISSNVNSERGSSMPFFVFDEAFFAKPGDSAVSGNAAIKAMIPALLKYGTHSMTFFPSSPASRSGRLYELYLEALKPDNFDTLICQMPSWETYMNCPEDMCPTAVPPDPNGSPLAQELALKEKVNPEEFRVEYRGQFADSTHAYFQPDIVKSIFTLDKPSLTRKPNQTYRIHCDPARVNDDFSYMVAHLEQTCLITDYFGVFRASDFENHVIDYVKVEENIQDLILKYRPVSVTFDQFNSAFLVDRLNKFCIEKRIKCQVKTVNTTAQSNREAFETLKREMGAGNVKAYKDNLNVVDKSRGFLEASLSMVQEKNGKIYKPRISGYGHLDLVDCLALLCWQFNENDGNKDKTRHGLEAWARSQRAYY